jgi:hypothetical protein
MYESIRKGLSYMAIFVFLVAISGCGLPGGNRKNVPQIEITVENTLAIKRTDEFVVLKVTDLKEMASNFSKDTFIVMDAASNKEIPSQVDDMNNDGEGDEIAMIMDLELKEKKRIVIRYSPESPDSRSVILGHKKRTRAAIHPEYEGIGWESELIGYMVHPDQRNSISIVGKQKPELSLDKLAYKIPSSSKIILNAGNTVGCGGFGIWDENKLMKPNSNTPRYTMVVSDGPVRSVARVIFDKWTLGDKILRVTATYSIFAGQRWCTSNVKITGSNMPIKIASGLMKSKSENLIKDEKKGLFYAYGAKTFGNALGMGVIYPPESFDSFQENEDSYLTVLNPSADNDITYWFLSAWGNDETGVKDASEFEKMVSSTAEKIRNPVTATIMPIETESK